MTDHDHRQDHDAFARRVSQLLRASADEVDGPTRAALLRARQRALQEATPARQRWHHLAPDRRPWRYLAPAGAAAAALLAVALLWNQQMASTRGDAAAVQVSAPELDLFADDDAWDIAREADLEFIEWAAAMARQRGVGT